MVFGVLVVGTDYEQCHNTRKIEKHYDLLDNFSDSYSKKFKYIPIVMCSLF